MITRSSLYHRPIDEWAYPINEETVHLKMRSRRGELQSVTLIYGDPFDWQHGQWMKSHVPLEKIGTDALFDYWLVALRPATRRLRYAFWLQGHEEQLYFSEKGVFPHLPEDIGCCFCFPYLHGSDVFQIPAWVKDTVWYQIFPERFANGDSSNDHPHTKPWASESPSCDSQFGGDLRGVCSRLDELVDLGITGIYLTPIFVAKSNHKYDTIDYMEIDPQFGTKEDLRDLVDACHDRGIRVMLDAVFNHSGYEFAPFQDVLANGAQSRYKNWFHCREFPLQGGARPNYETFSFVETMPKLNTQNLELRHYLLEVGRYWIKEFDIDGWRLDVANEIDHSFWRDFRLAVKDVKPDLYILGEVWHDAIPWLRGDQFDGVMNYPFYQQALAFLAHRTLSATQFAETMTTILQSYPATVNAGLFPLLGSHDTKRILTECRGHVPTVKLLYVLLLTFTGTPCIYYGDEIGLQGDHDPGCRACMVWDKEAWNHEIREHIKNLIALRKSYPLLANDGTLTFLPEQTDGPCLAYLRQSRKEAFLVILNPTDQQVKYSLPFDLKGKTVIDLISQQEITAEATHLAVTLPAFDWTILKLPEK